VPETLEIIVPHVRAVGPVTQLRSTLVQSSLGVLKERGHFEAWSSAVDSAHRTTILEAVAPVWLPIEVGMAHYAACEALRLPQHELAAVGEAVGSRIQNTFLATVTRAAQQAGMTPWAPLPHFGRVWSRLFMGGSAELKKMGPKDLQIEIKGLGLLRYAYVRSTYAALVRAALLLFGARTAYVNVARWQPGSSDLVLLAAWV
jgi:hypothetical protein